MSPTDRSAPDRRPSWLRRVDARLDGPAARLPASLDDIAEWWAQVRPRGRVLLVGATVCLALVLAVGRGETTSRVLVARTDLEAGARLGPGDVELVDYPDRLLPRDPLLVLPDHHDVRTRTPLVAGRPILTRDVASGLEALLPEGHVAVPLPRDLAPGAEPGRRVDVIGSDPGPGQVAARGATVLAVEGDQVWLAVPRGEAGRLATLLAHSRPLLVLTP